MKSHCLLGIWMVSVGVQSVMGFPAAPLEPRSRGSQTQARTEAGKKDLEKIGVIALPGVEGRFDHFGVDTRQQLGKISLPAHPESFQLEPNGSRIWVNVPEASQIAVANRKQLRIETVWPMKKFRANFPMALDAQRRRLFTGCRQPARLLILDVATGRAVSDLPIHGDSDDLFFDAARQRIYVSCGEGYIDIVEQTGQNQYRAAASIQTAPGARTSWYSPELNRLILAVPHRGREAAALWIYNVRD